MSTPARYRLSASSRRRLAAAGLLAPGALLMSASVYAVLGAFQSRCTTSFSSGPPGARTTSCASSGSDVALVTFPAALVCLVVGVAVLRAVRWSRWAAILAGAVLATVVAAGSLAGVVALAGDSNDATGAVALGLGGAALTALCALPALLLGGEGGRAAYGVTEEPDED